MVKRKKTAMAGMERSLENARQLHAKKGWYYEHWKKAMRHYLGQLQ